MLRARVANWSKWRLMAAWWGVQAGLTPLAVAVWAVGSRVIFKAPLLVELRQGLDHAAKMITDLGFLLFCGAPVLVLMTVQTIIVWPVRRPRPVWKGEGRSMWVTLGVCGLLIGAVWGGAVLAVMDISWLAGGYNWSHDDPSIWWWLLAPGVLGWMVATPLLVRFARRGHREERLGRIASRLFLGTVIEVVAIVPLDVMVRRKTDCYCGRGTFWAFLLCGTAGFAAMGPAVLLPLIARRRKRWYAGHCDSCGYDMAGLTSAARCPECGAGWSGDGTLDQRG